MIFNTCCVHRTGLVAPPEPALRICWVLPNPSRLPDDYDLVDFAFEVESLEDAWIWVPYGFSFAPLGYDCEGWSDGVKVFKENDEYPVEDFNLTYDFRGKAVLIMTAQWKHL